MEVSQLLEREKNKLKSLPNQREMLFSLRKRHLLWAGLTSDEAIKRLHNNVADSVQRAMSEVECLLEALDITGQKDKE